jgi:hypothetical protein
MDAVGPADCCRTGFGQADVSDFAFGYQIGKGTNSIFNRNILIDPVLIVQVDMVGAEAPQGTFDCDANVRRAAVNDARATAEMRDQTEFRGQDYFVPPVFDGPTDEFFVREGTVDLSGVYMGHSQVERPMDSADGFGVAACADIVVAGHCHGPEPYAGDVEPAE